MAARTADVTEEQWAEARRLFTQQLRKRKCGTLTKAKFDRIITLLTSWDTFTPAERRDMDSAELIGATMSSSELR